LIRHQGPSILSKRLVLEFSNHRRILDTWSSDPWNFDPFNYFNNFSCKTSSRNWLCRIIDYIEIMRELNSAQIMSRG